MILKLIIKTKVNFYTNHLGKNEYLLARCCSVLLLWNLAPPYIQTIYQNSAKIFETVN